MGRTVDREGFDAAQRIRLLELDADRHDAEFASLDARLARIQQVLVGILISVTTASILLVVNVATITR